MYFHQLINIQNTEDFKNAVKINQKPPKLESQNKSSVQLEKVKSPVIHKFQKPTGVKLKISNKNKLLDYND